MFKVRVVYIPNITFKTYKYMYDNRAAISQASCRRLPAFQFDYRLIGIGDNFVGNNVLTSNWNEIGCLTGDIVKAH